ncbi:MAG: glycosyltransferase family 4 protein [bacterium]|nr:glycosyltransferase family 4 protein [bacterium]
MNLLIVSQYFFPENFRINDLALGLLERGHQVTVLTGLPNYPEGQFFAGYGWGGPWRESWAGIEIIRSPMLARGQSKKQLALNYLSFAALGSLRAMFSCRQPFDAVFVYGPSPITAVLPAIALKKMTGAPLHYWVQDLWPDSLTSGGGITNPKIIEPVRKLSRWIYDQCDFLLLSSQSFKERLLEMGQASDKLLYFPQWAEADFTNSTARLNPSELAELPPGFRILYAGNIGEAQGFETLLEAATRLKDRPEIQWIILGGGRKAEWVAEEVTRRGLQSCFHLLGRKPLEQMPAYFKEADCLLVSLKSDPLNAMTLPAKVQAYMAFGAPILAALEGEGAQVVLESGAGMVADSGNAEQLAQQALALAGLDEARRKAMGKAGVTYAKQHFDRDQLLSWLETQLARRSG